VPTDSFLDFTYAGVRAVLGFAHAGGIDLAFSRPTSFDQPEFLLIR
jgi:hypothetical protein